MDEARSRAVADARSRAEVLAQAADVDLGPVQSIRESSGSVPVQRQRLALSARAADAVPVATGELDFRVQVQLVFTIESHSP